MKTLTVREFLANVYSYSPDDVITINYKPKELTIEQVANYVAICCGYSKGEDLKINKSSRKEYYKLERWLFFIFCKLLTNESPKHIGLYILQHRTNVIHAWAKIKLEMQEEFFKTKFTLIKEQLNSDGYFISEYWKEKL